MNTRGLQKHYDKLTDLERFRLVLAAKERDDENEAQALRDTAPKATYRMTAWPYRGMWDGIFMVTMATVTDVLASGFMLALAWGRVRRGEIDADDELPSPVQMATESARSILADWWALELFCEELGITRAQALEHAPATGYAQNIVEFAAAVVPMLEEDFAYWLATEELGLEGEELEAAMVEREATLVEQLRKEAEAGADLLRHIWERRVE